MRKSYLVQTGKHSIKNITAAKKSPVFLFVNPNIKPLGTSSK